MTMQGEERCCCSAQLAAQVGDGARCATRERGSSRDVRQQRKGGARCWKFLGALDRELGGHGGMGLGHGRKWSCAGTAAAGRKMNRALKKIWASMGVAAARESRSRGRRAIAGRGEEGEHAIGEEQQWEGWALFLLPSLKGGRPWELVPLRKRSLGGGSSQGGAATGRGARLASSLEEGARRRGRRDLGVPAGMELGQGTAPCACTREGGWGGR
jgi:hypothetical protein